MKDATHHSRSRSALVLSGGGANGAYELGVMKGLISGLSPSTRHSPLTPSTIAATSIGAFNGSVLLSNLDHGWPAAVDALEQVWVERMASPSVAIRNGVMRYRMNPIDWANDVMNDPMGPARDFAADAMFLARDWTARLAGFVGSSSGLAGRVAELFDASQFLTAEPSAMRPLSSMVDAMSRMLVASFAATMRRDLEVAAKVDADVKAGKDHHRRAIEIHLYRPVEDMGGALGMLDFHRARVTALIERGYRDAIGHDCKANGCVNVN